MLTYIREQIAASIEGKQKILRDDVLLMQIAAVAEEAVNVYRNGHKILVCGNGGSAADAQHIAGELVSRFYFDRPALPAIAITTDTSVLTAIGNDYGYEHVFARQVQAIGTPGDMLIAISTSGSSRNILRAIEVAKETGLSCVGLTGHRRGDMNDLCDYTINIPSTETPRIQEMHILIGHVLCAIVEESLFGDKLLVREQ